MKSLEELKNNIYEKINEIRNFDTDGSKVFNEDETYNYEELDAYLERNKKERPTFNKGSRIMYTIEDENGNTHTVTRLSKRCYELKECKTLFVTDDEGVVTGIYKEK